MDKKNMYTMRGFVTAALIVGKELETKCDLSQQEVR